jgi:hypothetical protein
MGRAAAAGNPSTRTTGCSPAFVPSLCVTPTTNATAMSDVIAAAMQDVTQAIDSLTTAKDAFKEDLSDRSVCLRVDLQHVIRNLQHGLAVLEDWQKRLEGAAK